MTEVHTAPFPHFVRQNVWSTDVLRDARAEFDRVPDHEWQRFRNDREHKDALTFSAAERLGLTACTDMRNVLSADWYVQALEEAFGIDGLQFDELGGGLHRIPPGGHLDPHIDFNRDHSGRYRRVNVLVYLNEGWPCEEAQGALVLYDEERLPFRVIYPEFNVTVGFACGEESWHGHPIASQVERRSLAAYYFTTEPPPVPAPVHDTVWMPGHA